MQFRGISLVDVVGFSRDNAMDEACENRRDRVNSIMPIKPFTQQPIERLTDR